MDLGILSNRFSFISTLGAASKPNAIANNTLKYLRLNGPLRAKLRAKWNPPITWPLWILPAIILILILPLTISYWLRERRPSTRRF